MATTLPRVPTSEDEDEEGEGPRAAPAAAASAGRAGSRAGSTSRSQNSEDRDPWLRRDPWQRGEPGRGAPRDPDYVQFLQWREGQQNRNPWSTNPWNFARDEHERTTAGPPPEWDGENLEFKDYKLKAKIWLRTTRTPPAARGPLLLKSLTKGPWEDLKFLAGQDEWLVDPLNGEKLIELMNTNEFYGEELREDMLAACSRITFHLRRQKGEKARTFLTRWDNAERKVRDHGVTLPPEFLGFLLVNALSLDSEVKQMLQYTKGGLKVTDIKEWLRVQETDLDMTSLGSEKKKQSGNYLLEPDEVHAVQHVTEENDASEDDEPVEMLLTAIQELEEGAEDLPAVEFTEAEAQEILMTMVKDKQVKRNVRTFTGSKFAKNNRDLARGYGAGRNGVLRPGNYKVSIEEIKKRTRCNHCNEVGHWRRECPQKSRPGAGGGQKSGKSQDVHYLESYNEAEIFLAELCHPENYVPDFLPEYDMAINRDLLDDASGFDWRHAQSCDFLPQVRPKQLTELQRPRDHSDPLLTDPHGEPSSEAWLHRGAILQPPPGLEKVSFEDDCHHEPGHHTPSVETDGHARTIWSVGHPDGGSGISPDDQGARGIVVEVLSFRLHERQIDQRGFPAPRSPTPSGWSQISSQVGDGRNMDYQEDSPRSLAGSTVSSRMAPMTPPRRAQRGGASQNVPQVPEMIDMEDAPPQQQPVIQQMMQNAPYCHCGYPARMKVSMTEQNHNRIFWRCYHRRGNQNQNSCAFFQWAGQQPLRPGVPTETDPVTYAQSQCKHPETTKAGSNHFVKKERCLICGLVLRHEKVNQENLEQATQPPKTKPASSVVPMSTLFSAVAPEYQDFLEWRRMRAQQDAAQASTWTPQDPPFNVFGMNGAPSRPPRSSRR
eukprot:s429_g9.t1